MFRFHSHIVATTSDTIRKRVTRVHEKKDDSTIEEVKDTQLDTTVMEHGNN